MQDGNGIDQNIKNFLGGLLPLNTTFICSNSEINTVFPVCVIHKATQRRDPPLSVSLDRIMTFFALYLDPQPIVPPVRLLNEVQIELFREIKALFSQLKMSGNDERHKEEREREIKKKERAVPVVATAIELFIQSLWYPVRHVATSF